MDAEARFWAKVDRHGPSECWTWKGATDGRYGIFWLDGQKIKAHRFSYIVANGVGVDPEVQVCHSCDNPPCVNPAHLWRGTMSENLKDAQRKGRVFNPMTAKTHCKNGHEFTVANIMLRKPNRPTGKQWRECRTCNIERLRRARAALAPPTEEKE